MAVWRNLVGRHLSGQAVATSQRYNGRALDVCHWYLIQRHASSARRAAHTLEMTEAGFETVGSLLQVPVRSSCSALKQRKTGVSTCVERKQSRYDCSEILRIEGQATPQVHNENEA